MTTVLLADDQAMVRGGFRMIIDAAPGLVVVGEAADGTEAVALARQLDPDIVLMDIRMPGVDGIEATRRLTRAGSRSRVLMLTTFDLDEHVYDSFRAGASGFLLKNAPPSNWSRPSAQSRQVTPCSRRRSPAGSSRSTCPGPERGLPFKAGSAS